MHPCSVDFSRRILFVCTFSTMYNLQEVKTLGMACTKRTDPSAQRLPHKMKELSLACITLLCLKVKPNLEGQTLEIKDLKVLCIRRTTYAAMSF